MPKGGVRISELRNLATFLRGSEAPRPLYHGTNQDISEFTSSPIWLTPERRVAGDYANRKAFGDRPDVHDEDYRSEDEFSPKFDPVEPRGQNVMPVFASIKKPLDLTDLGAANTISDIIGELQEKGFLHDIDEDNWGDVVNEAAGNLSTEDVNVDPETTYVPTYRLLEELGIYPDIQKAGYDGIKLLDTDVHGRPHESWAAFRPGQVKSSIGNEGTFDPTNPVITKAKGGVIKAPLDALHEMLRSNPAFADWFKQSKAIDENGDPLRVFHGSNRIDRLQEGIKAKRASSGPMPFFTDDPKIASNYAEGKSDTSLDDIGYDQWFTFRPKGSRTDRPLKQMWYYLTPEQRKSFNEKMRNIGMNEDTGEIEDQGPGGGVAPSHWDWLVGPENGEHRGNGLSAAVDIWLQSANLFNDEHKFMDALRLAGLDTSKVKFTDFKHGQPGVLPAFLSIQNPLRTNAIPPEVIDALDEASSRQRIPRGDYLHGDIWDKNLRHPHEWVDQLKEDVAKGANSHVWTSIPDWVTGTLRELGYDGIQDTGGKLGGEGHDVWIPFDAGQIKSPFNRGTFDPTSADVSKAKGGVIKVPRTELEQLKEYVHGLTPQKGMFSTLDQLVQQAPFELGSAEQWQNYLKPGRMLQRDEMQFPLKQQELDYSIAPFLAGAGHLGNLSKFEVLDAMRRMRPAFGQSLKGYPNSVIEGARPWTRPEWDISEDPGRPATRFTTSPATGYGPENYDARLSHQTPDSIYQESLTKLAGLDHPSHFGGDTLSWARTSTHDLPGGERMRLIEEIQSDLHQQAAERLEHDPHFYMTDEEKAQYDALTQESTDFNYLPPGPFRDEGRAKVDALRNEIWQEAYKRIPRRGYNTPDEQAELAALRSKAKNKDELARQAVLADRVPDAPFKDPAEYAQLEIRKQLLHAADEGEDYLGLTRGSDQRERYGGAGEGTEYFYDQLYPSVMKKLAKHYGAEMVEVPLKTKTGVDIRPQLMREVDAEDMDEFLDQVHRGAYFRSKDPYYGVINDLADEFPDSPQVHEAAERARDAVHRYGDVPPDEDNSDELMDLHEAMNNLWYIYKDKSGSATTQTKTFPAIKLTPEVRERIKRIGAPIFSVGAGAAPFVGPTQEQAEEPEGHAKGGVIKAPRTDLEALREYHNALAPQLGMFSTLDKLIETAPFERGSSEQWRNYLKPGRAFTREGIQFPLKKEELEHSDLLKTLNALELGGEGAENLSKLMPAESILDPTSPTKDQLLTLLRRNRPRFGLYAGFEDHYPNAKYEQLAGKWPDPNSRLMPLSSLNWKDWAHSSPGSRYEESATALEGLNYPTHYTRNTLSHSRASVHDTDVNGEHGKVRLIEEIQADPAQDAAEKIAGRRTPDETLEYGRVTDHVRQLQNELDTPDLDPKTYSEIATELSAARRRQDELANIPETRRARKGFFSPEEEQEFQALDDKLRNSSEQNGWSDEEASAARARYKVLADKKQNTVPDVPFKDAAEYGRLEMRKQLLNAANGDEDYLALTRPEDQIERYSLEGDDADAMHHIYGSVYRKEFEKLAKQYGAEMTEVPLKHLTEETDTRPETMQDWGEESMEALIDRLIHRDRLNDIDTDGGLIHELAFGTLEPGYRDVAQGIADKADKAKDLTQELKDMLYEQELAYGKDDSDILQERLGDPDNPDQDLGAEYTQRELRAEINAYHQEHADRVSEAKDALVEQLDDLYRDYLDVQKKQNVSSKTFPAMKLTPEVKQRIKQAGVPLFSIGAGAATAPFVGPLQEQEDEQQPQTFAEGGDVSADDDYSENPFAHHSKAEERQQLEELRNLAAHFGLGAKTGWMHYEPGHGVGMYETPGTARPFLHYKEGAVDENTPVDPETGMLLAPMEMEKPDIVDELAGLPELLTLGHGPQWSKEASDRSQALDAILREDMGVKPPSSFLEYLAEAGGNMAGQLPTGDLGAGVRGLTGVGKMTGPLRHLLKIPSAAVEWFSPTINPSVRNYLHGTAAGTALMAGLPELMKLRKTPATERFNQANADIEEDVKHPVADPDNQEFIDSFITGN